MREEIIDIEQHSKEGKEVPEAKSYRIRIDRTHHEVEVPQMTGRELLTLAGKNPPDRFSLHQKLRGGETSKVSLDEVVNFTAPGLERFMTLPLDQTEGGEPAVAEHDLRCNFDLPDDDIIFLDSLGLTWETISEGSVRRVVIYGRSLPDGYNQRQVDLNFRIEPMYPDTQLDMVYFTPALSRKDGTGIGALSNDIFDGKVWQRWSRHRTPQNPWRPGIDNIETHYILVGAWLERDQGKVSP